MIFYSFRSYRFAGYKPFSLWIHKRLVEGVGKVIFSCASWSDGKIILQSMGVISLSRKAVTTKQESYMDITDVL